LIGIFWVYKETVFGKAINIEEGEEFVQGVIDSPDNHTDYWDTEKEYLKLFPELRFREYFDVTRGRVLYNRKDGQANIYMDKVLFNDKTKQLIKAFFQINDTKSNWRTDPHYTTSADDLDELLDW
jgi:hypothetical protein